MVASGRSPPIVEPAGLAASGMSRVRAVPADGLFGMI